MLEGRGHQKQAENEVIAMGRGTKETRHKSVDHRSDFLLCL